MICWCVCDALWDITYYSFIYRESHTGTGITVARWLWTESADEIIQLDSFPRLIPFAFHTGKIRADPKGISRNHVGMSYWYWKEGFLLLTLDRSKRRKPDLIKNLYDLKSALSQLIYTHFVLPVRLYYLHLLCTKKHPPLFVRCMLTDAYLERLSAPLDPLSDSMARTEKKLDR